eukprot:354545-Chlamydomonas_euryale.AAC.9
MTIVPRNKHSSETTTAERPSTRPLNADALDSHGVVQNVLIAYRADDKAPSRTGLPSAPRCRSGGSSSPRTIVTVPTWLYPHSCVLMFVSCVGKEASGQLFTCRTESWASRLAPGLQTPHNSGHEILLLELYVQFCPSCETRQLGTNAYPKRSDACGAACKRLHAQTTRFPGRPSTHQAFRSVRQQAHEQRERSRQAAQRRHGRHLRRPVKVPCRTARAHRRSDSEHQAGLQHATQQRPHELQSLLCLRVNYVVIFIVRAAIRARARAAGCCHTIPDGGADT